MANERFDQFGRTVTTAYLQSTKQQSVVIGSFESVGKTPGGRSDHPAGRRIEPVRRAAGSRTLNADSAGVSGQARSGQLLRLRAELRADSGPASAEAGARFGSLVAISSRASPARVATTASRSPPASS